MLTEIKRAKGYEKTAIEAEVARWNSDYNDDGSSLLVLRYGVYGPRGETIIDGENQGVTHDFYRCSCGAVVINCMEGVDEDMTCPECGEVTEL